ncbi:hypothetical protein SDJN02_16379, partial [Cucurbita argyrosperma subsp. argyrosperma]
MGFVEVEIEPSSSQIDIGAVSIELCLNRQASIYGNFFNCKGKGIRSRLCLKHAKERGELVEAIKANPLDLQYCNME